MWVKKIIGARSAVATALLAALSVACSPSAPMENVRIQSDAVIWKGSSSDGKVTAYLLRTFEGGATGDTLNDLVIGDAGQSHGRLVLRCDAGGPDSPLAPAWHGNVLYVKYSAATIWAFSNTYLYGRGASARTYEIVLEKQSRGAVQ